MSRQFITVQKQGVLAKVVLPRQLHRDTAQLGIALQRQAIVGDAEIQHAGADVLAENGALQPHIRQLRRRGGFDLGRQHVVFERNAQGQIDHGLPLGGVGLNAEIGSKAQGLGVDQLQGGGHGAFDGQFDIRPLHVFLQVHQTDFAARDFQAAVAFAALYDNVETVFIERRTARGIGDPRHGGDVIHLQAVRFDGARHRFQVRAAVRRRTQRHVDRGAIRNALGQAIEHPKAGVDG